jgi:RNA polymerase sigma factor (sigma-70 family)
MKVNQEQFQQWHDQYRPRLLASITAMVRDRDQAEDLTAQALATALEKIDQFQGKAGFGTWLTRIAINEMYNRRRRKQNVSLDAVGEASSLWSEPDRVSDDLERSESCQKLREALSELPAKYRQPLADYFLRDHSISPPTKGRCPGRASAPRDGPRPPGVSLLGLRRLRDLAIPDVQLAVDRQADWRCEPGFLWYCLRASRVGGRCGQSDGSRYRGYETAVFSWHCGSGTGDGQNTL